MPVGFSAVDVPGEALVPATSKSQLYVAPVVPVFEKSTLPPVQEGAVEVNEATGSWLMVIVWNAVSAQTPLVTVTTTALLPEPV